MSKKADDRKTKVVGSVLEKLKAQKAVLEKRIEKAEAFVKTKARKQDLQRKILVGEYYLEQTAKNGALAALRKTLREVLKRESDKALFEDKD
jgi:chromosome segregation ATPase